MTDPQDAPERENKIQEAMAKTRIAPDLLEGMTEKVKALEGAMKPEAQLFPVVIEMNAAFPHGPNVARAMLLRQFLKEGHGAGEKVHHVFLDRNLFASHESPPSPHPSDRDSEKRHRFNDARD